MNFLSVTLSAVILVASVQTTLGQQCKIGLSVPSSTKHKHSRKSTHSVAFDLPTSCDGGSSISLDLPDGSTKTFNRKQSGGSGNANADARISSVSYESWMGEGDDGSYMNFIKTNGNVFASVVDMTAKTITQINIDYNGEQIAVTTPVSDFPPEGEPVDPKNARKLVAKIQKEKNQHILGDYSSHVKNSETTVIEVMVVWTTQAECAAANAGVGCDPNTFSTENMRGLIDLNFYETNVMFYESAVDLEIYNLYMYLDSTYVEDYNAFDGALWAIQKRHKQNRISIGADMAVMMIDGDEYLCGVGLIGPGIERMYSVTGIRCATGYHAFGHELGHNLGLHHDRGTKNDCSSPNIHFGYREPGAKFRTTMAYDCVSGQCDNNAGGGCPKLQRFSNPALNYTIGNYTGALGVVGQSNNALVLNTTGKLVSQYYYSGNSSAVPTVNPSETPSVPTVNPSETPSAVPTVNPSETPSATYCSDITGWSKRRTYKTNDVVRIENRVFKATNKKKNKGKDPTRNKFKKWWSEVEGGCTYKCLEVGAWKKTAKYWKGSRVRVGTVLYESKKPSKNRNPTWSKNKAFWTSTGPCAFLCEGVRAWNRKKFYKKGLMVRVGTVLYQSKKPSKNKNPKQSKNKGFWKSASACVASDILYSFIESEDYFSV